MGDFESGFSLEIRLSENWNYLMCHKLANVTHTKKGDTLEDVLLEKNWEHDWGENIKLFHVYIPMSVTSQQTI